MTESTLIFVLGVIVILLFCYLSCMEYVRRKQEREILTGDRLIELTKEKALGIMDLILFYLPGDDLGILLQHKESSPEMQELAEEYLKLILTVYDICGSYCRENHFSDKEVNLYFSRYIRGLKDEEHLCKLIRKRSERYDGLDYLMNVCS